MAYWVDGTSGVLVTITVLSGVAAWTSVPAIIFSTRWGRLPTSMHRRSWPWRILGMPGSSLFAVAGLIYLNQALLTVYVIRVHDGDAQFISRYLPAGWFDLATDSSLLIALASAFPFPELLAPTVLRVQAFLELPFVLLAYLTVCRWLDPALYRRVARSPLVWLASASYTLIFCVIEWALRNPYTLDDIFLRSAAALVAPAWVTWIARYDPGRTRSKNPSPFTLLAFTASVWALGLLILTVYDTALLYNLGRLRPRLPDTAIAFAVLAAARASAHVLERSSPFALHPTPSIQITASSIWWFLALFFVIALPVRYAAAEPAARIVAAITVLASTVFALRRSHFQDTGAPDSSRPATAGLILQMSAALVAGGAAAYAALRWVQPAYPEAFLLHAGCVFLATAIVVNGLLDMALLRPDSAIKCGS